MITFDPTTTKPTYPDAFDMVGALPPTIKFGVRHLLLRIWRHTNNSPADARFGTAWMAHPRLAQEMGYGEIGDLFDDAEKLGVVGREHHFKKRDGTVAVSTIYHDGIKQGLGEYVGSRYWVIWSKVKELAQMGIGKNPTPIGIGKNPMPEESASYAKIGIGKKPIRIGKIPTKVLIEGLSSQHLPSPSRDRAVGERTAGEPSPTETALTPVVVDGGSPNFSLARTGPRTTIGPTVPAPSSFSDERQRRGQNNSDPSEDRAEVLISSARLRELERGMTDAAIYREYKAVFDRLVREADAYDRTPKEKRDNLPRGKAFENPLKTTKTHRRDAAEIYRADGGKVALAAWEKFLVEIDHTKVTGKRNHDEDNMPTNGFHAVEEEGDWMLHDFVLDHVIPQPAPPVVSTASDEDRAVDVIVRYGGWNHADAVNLYRNSAPAMREHFLTELTEAIQKGKS
jgi:hypothetical protein